MEGGTRDTDRPGGHLGVSNMGDTGWEGTGRVDTALEDTKGGLGGGGAQEWGVGGMGTVAGWTLPWGY